MLAQRPLAERGTATAAPVSPAAKVTVPITITLAARTWPRAGLAASVVRSRPRRYSAALNMAAITVIAISPANAPVRVRAGSAAVLPAHGRGDVTGPADREHAAGLMEAARAARAPLPRPTSVPVQAPGGQAPRLT